MSQATAANLWRVDGGKLSLSLHPGQSKAWSSDRRFTFVLAGTQSGKTSFVPWWLWREVRRCGPGDYLAVTASYDLFKLKMLPELRQVFERILKLGKYWAGDRIIELADPETGRFWAKRSDDPMWGRIILRSAEAGGGLESTTAKAAILDECGQDSFTVETWEAVLRRLSLSRGRVLGATTPYNLGWLKTEAYDRWLAGDPDFGIIQFPSYFNPLFSREEYARAKRTMPLWRFLMFYDGQFSKPAGLIYDCYDEDVHLCDPFDIPPAWPRYVGLDFGANNTALLWVAENPETSCFFAYRESLEGGQSTEEHCQDALQHAQGENVVQWLGGAASEQQQRWDWQNEGVPVDQPYISDVEAGITRCYGLLKSRRIKFFRTLTGIRDELGTYKRELDKSGQPTEKIANKRKFHRLDAWRYVSSALVDGGGLFVPATLAGRGREGY